MDSARVRLEVALLASDATSSALAKETTSDAPQRLTVLVVSADTDFRWYVRECLRDRTDVHLVEAKTVTEALTIAAHGLLDLLVVDAPLCELLMALPEMRAIVIVDNEPRRERRSGARVRFLARPFSGDALNDEVERIME